LEDKPVVLGADGSCPQGVNGYVFDHCFNSDSTQEQVYNKTVKPAVKAVLGGFNATVFAYGQTGTGKTHTMQGDENDNALMGMGPRAVYEIFEKFSGKLC